LSGFASIALDTLGALVGIQLIVRIIDTPSFWLSAYSN
jgi:hypothetical protein